MRIFSYIMVVLMLTVVSILPTLNQSTNIQSNPIIQSQNRPVDIPDEIDFINQVKQTVDHLNHSPHIMTIHHNENEKSHAVKREVIVKFKQNPNEEQFAQIYKDINGQMKRHWDQYWIFKSKTKSKKEMIQYFHTREDVVYAEPNFLLLPNQLPNDPLYPRFQWNLPKIKVDEAWDVTRGDQDIVIAVIDTGIDLTHPDFEGQLVPGYNVLTDTGHPLDDNGHGSHVAGIIAASTNNNVGIAGISWNNKIMPVKAIGGEGTGSSFDIARGIRWSADHGARVINMSVGNYHPSIMLKEAIRYAYDKGIVLVAASGNDSTSQPSYPASYPEVISVAAVDPSSRRAAFSNYGSSIELSAPGVDIPSTYIYNEYASLSGTSMAAPHVAGLAGLILSVQPEWSNEQTRRVIQQSAENLGTPGRNEEYGYGLINVSKALQLTMNDPSPETVWPLQTNAIDPPFGDRLSFKSLLRSLFNF